MPLPDCGVAKLSHPKSSRLEEGDAARVSRAARTHPCRAHSWWEQAPASRRRGAASRLETGTATEAAVVSGPSCRSCTTLSATRRATVITARRMRKRPKCTNTRSLHFTLMKKTDELT